MLNNAMILQGISSKHMKRNGIEVEMEKGKA
jgi:hypothetical protein